MVSSLICKVEMRITQNEKEHEISSYKYCMHNDNTIRLILLSLRMGHKEIFILVILIYNPVTFTAQ